MTTIEPTQFKEIFVGDMGIKEAYLGDKLVYTRPGAHFYLELSTKTTNDNEKGD